jgi:hypothetical protein
LPKATLSQPFAKCIMHSAKPWFPCSENSFFMAFVVYDCEEHVYCLGGC